MLLDTGRTRQHLKSFDFQSLFIEELGWDHHTQTLQVQVDSQRFNLAAIALKRGLVAFLCDSAADGSIPDYPTRRKIEHRVAKSVHEHLIVYTDAEKSTQVWQWVKRELGKPAVCREHRYYSGQPGDALIQKLEGIAFTLEEEEGLTIVDVAGLTRAAFNVDRVTRRFYDRFKSEHAAFLGFLRGIPDEAMERWYASVMINRLMFIYFVQKKGFIDGDPNYLRNKLAQSTLSGKDRYYRDFLCPLFFDGFAKREEDRASESRQLLGKVPYLDGGIFLPHQVEEAHGKTIQIADYAFEKLFGFFEQYQWHLDERPLRKGDEINPDVLGYIFEKYINDITQRQMGAYYTREDITGYISRNTVIPRLFDMAKPKCRIAFEGEHSVWRLLQSEPDRYIHDAVKKGVDLPLPEDIAAGLNDVSKRDNWNRPAPHEFALPTEIWREVLARRKRYEEVWTKLVGGEIQEINDLITYNLDIRQFAQDVIETCEGPELLRAFWRAIREITILDPTCGSGAFLFAALGILEPLYEACLDRMQVFVDELERSGEKHRPEKFSDFREVLAEVAKHSSKLYFILKSIILNNLFGVDIMEEAVEICKLRLFLKLVAQVERFDDIEPLPDIDFNICAGNTLVGFTNRDEIQHAMTMTHKAQMKMLSAEDMETMRRIDESAQDVDRLFGLFRRMQIEYGMDSKEYAKAKGELRCRLESLENELNVYLAAEYGVVYRGEATKGISLDYSRWLESHKPFHWFIEFYGIMRDGGFDVVIGNPPYVEYSKVRREYSLLAKYEPYSTNLYSACCFRSVELNKKRGYSSFIVPVSLPSTDRMEPLRLSLARGHAVYQVGFSTRPSKLFEGTEQRLTIYILSPSEEERLYSGGYLKWYKEERPHLFATILYVDTSPIGQRHHIWPKTNGSVHRAVCDKMHGFREMSQLGILGGGSRLYYKNTGIRYFSTVTLRPPKCWINGIPTSSSRETVLDVHSQYLHAIHALLLCTTFFLYWETTSNCRDLNPSDILLVPTPGLSSDLHKLAELSEAAERDYTSKGRILRMQNKLTGLVEIESVTPADSKPIIDEIDRALAKHYGFTDEELDFIINYDIKYRLGRDVVEEEE